MIFFTNAYQLSPSKKEELSSYINSEKLIIIAINEVKPKNGKWRDILDCNNQDTLYIRPTYAHHLAAEELLCTLMILSRNR